MLAGHLLQVGQTQSTACCQSGSHQNHWQWTGKMADIKIGLVSVLALRGLKACLPDPAQLRPVLLLDVQGKHHRWSAAAAPVWSLRAEHWLTAKKCVKGVERHMWHPDLTDHLTDSCIYKNWSKHHPCYFSNLEWFNCFTESRVKYLMYLSIICINLFAISHFDWLFLFLLLTEPTQSNYTGIRPNDCTSQLT